MLATCNVQNVLQVWEMGASRQPVDPYTLPQGQMNAGNDAIVDWSPDGKWIVFQANWQIYVIPDAGGQPKSVVSRPASDGYASF